MSDITSELEALDTWITVCLTLAAIFVTAFPLLYSMSPWYRSALGRALMFKALSFAVAVDMTLVFRLWDSEPVLLAYWITAFAYTFIAVTTGGLVVMLLYYNFYLGDDHDDSK